ncbi:hypothetical protein ID866_10874, partial [Astraeus odoratus]
CDILDMAARNVCRFLPNDQAAINEFVHNVVIHSRVLHGRHPVTNKVVAQPGELVVLSKVAHNDLSLRHLRSRLSGAGVVLSEGPFDAFPAQELSDVLREFLEFIEKDSVTNMLFKQMFEQAKPPAPGQQGSKDYVDLLNQFNFILSDPPKFATGASAMVAAVPYYALLSRFCNTPSGFTAFTDPTIDGFLRRMLDEWHAFLLTEASTGMLTDKKEGGWFTDEAVKAMVDSAGKPGKLFQDVFVCNPSDPSGKYGFKDYDSFFTKELVGLQNKEMIEDAYNKETVNMPCSANIYTLTEQPLKLEDRFWIKETPYSLRHILGSTEEARRFEGGTLFQAMLSSLDYHGWRSPVIGRVVKTLVIPGTHYAGLVDPTSEDPDPISRSQDFVTAISTRALIYIEAEPPVGLVVFVGVGLGEVSTCEILVKDGDKVEKGDKLGYFHFGGSTFCLIFNKNVRVQPVVCDGD